MIPAHALHLTGGLLPAVAVCLVVAGCQQQTSNLQLPAEPDSPVVATIGGQIFTEADIDAEIASMPDHLQHFRQESGIRRQVLRALMRRHALSHKAEEIQLDRDPIIRHRIQRAREDILIQHLQDWQLGNLPEPTEQQVAEYYEKHRSEFSIPEQVHARHILVASEKKARNVIRQLRRGRDFSALAATLSLDDSNKARGGDLNWFPRGVMVKPFEDAVFALDKPGMISKPVKTQFGWHVIELLGRKPASQKSQDEVREEIINILNQKALSAWVDDIVKKAGGRILRQDYKQDPA